MHAMNTISRPVSGNILFVILIAIGLFALLGSVVMDGDTATNQISKDKAKLAAQEILAYAQSVEQGVQRMLSKGVSENDLCFDYDEYPGGNSDYEHAACATESNRVFHPSGGGVRYRAPEANYLDTAYSAQTNYGTYFISAVADVLDLPRGTGSAGNHELILFLPAVKKNICIALNNILNIGLKNQEPVAEFQVAFTNNAHFQGSFTPGPSNQIGNMTAPYDIWSGKHNGCFQAEADLYADGYVFYQVLHVR